MAFNLIGKFGLDGSGFMRGMDAVEGRAKKTKNAVMSEFGSGIKAQLAALFGFSAVIQGMKSAVAEATRIREEARKAGQSVEEFQRAELAARGVAGSVEDFSILSESTVNKLANLGSGMEQVFGRVKTSFAEVATLIKDVLAPLFEQFERQLGSVSVFLGSLSVTKSFSKSLDAVSEFGREMDRKRTDRLIGGNASTPTTETAIASGGRASATRVDRDERFRFSDSLSRVGLFQGAAPDPGAADRKESLRELKRLNTYVQSMKNDLKNVV